MFQWREKLRNLFLADMASKRDDPNYEIIRGHVPVALYKRFKLFCVERKLDNSKGLEELLQKYFDWEDTHENTNQKET